MKLKIKRKRVEIGKIIFPSSEEILNLNVVGDLNVVRYTSIFTFRSMRKKINYGSKFFALLTVSGLDFL